MASIRPNRLRHAARSFTKLQPGKGTVHRFQVESLRFENDPGSFAQVSIVGRIRVRQSLLEAGIPATPQQILRRSQTGASEAADGL